MTKKEFEVYRIKLEKVYQDLGEIEKWDFFEIEDFGIKKKDLGKNIIKHMLGRHNGIYAIYQKKKCLYIGKGKPIFKRISTHDNEVRTFSKKYKVFKDFFSGYKGKRLRIYWKKLDDEYPLIGERMRCSIENRLQNSTEVEFYKFLAKVYNNDIFLRYGGKVKITYHIND